MASLSEKIDFLRREFAELDINNDNLISKEELYNFLDHKSGRIFDRDVADELFDRMDKDHNNRVTVDEYIKIFIQAEEVLKNKIRKITLSLELCQAESQRVFNEYNDVIQIEKLNEYDIMFGSVLEVLIVNADNLRIHNYNQYNVMAYCLLSCASRKFQTKLTNYENPVWNESFSFPIYEGNEHLQILIKDNIQNNFEFIGEIIFPIQKFSNQKKNDLILDITDRDGNLQGGKIHIVVQWIFSKSKYLKENLEFLEKEVLLLLDSKRDYEESLKTLYQPFKGLMNIKNDFQIEKIEKKNTKIESNSPQISNFCSITKYNGYLLLTASFLFLSFLICFNRNIFLDIMIYNIYIAMRHLKRMNQKVLRLLIVSLVVSLIIDMSWMIVFSEHYWNPNSTILLISVYERTLNRFVVVMSYIIFILKIGLTLVYASESIAPEMRVY